MVTASLLKSEATPSGSTTDSASVSETSRISWPDEESWCGSPASYRPISAAATDSDPVTVAEPPTPTGAAEESIGPGDQAQSLKTSDPVVGRATHAADRDLDTPTPLMLSIAGQRDSTRRAPYANLQLRTMHCRPPAPLTSLSTYESIGGIMRHAQGRGLAAAVILSNARSEGACHKPHAVPRVAQRPGEDQKPVDGFPPHVVRQ